MTRMRFSYPSYLRRQSARLPARRPRRRRSRIKTVGGVPKSVAGSTRVEKKYIDTNMFGEDIAVTGTFQNLTLCGQGPSVTERDGNQIVVKSLQLQGYLRRDASSTNNGDVVRLMLVIDTQHNESPILTGDLLEGAGVGGELTYQPLNRDHAQRFWVLWDKKFTLTDDKPLVTLDVFKRLNVAVKYTGPGTAASIDSNSFNLFFVTDTPSTATPVLEAKNRLRFTDPS